MTVFKLFCFVFIFVFKERMFASKDRTERSKEEVEIGRQGGMEAHREVAGE